MAKQDPYAVVTDRIIEALEAGVVPWHKPWKSLSGHGPTSLQTGKPYRGVNVWILSVTSLLRGYSSPYWVTFKQAKERGGSVRKGEKGTQVVLWKPFYTEDKETGERVKRFMMRYFTVFNVDQCDDVTVPTPEPVADFDPIEAAEALSERYRKSNGPALRHAGDRAFYAPTFDSVTMPIRGSFDSIEHYYGTLFHEYAHSTGHESRLARKSLIHPAPFGSEDYSKEELVAEMAAAFMCGEAGIPVNVEHHAAYIGSWLEVLKADRRMLVQAAAAAQKAADMVIGREADSKKEEPSEAPSRSVTYRKESHGHPHPRADYSRSAGLLRRSSRGATAGNPRPRLEHERRRARRVTSQP